MKATRENPILYIVIPCYNEQEVLPITSKLFLKKITDLVAAGKISDTAACCLSTMAPRTKPGPSSGDLAKSDKHYIGISQSRNRGSPERSAGRFDGSQGQVRYHHLH